MRVRQVDFRECVPVRQAEWLHLETAAMIHGMVEVSAPGAAVTGVPENRHRRKRLWLVLAALITAAAISITVTVVSQHYADAPSIRCTCGTGWVSSIDADAEIQSNADARSQTTVPVRLGQEQAFMFQVVNPSHVTQTILGLPTDFFFGIVRGPTQLRISVSGNPDIDPRSATYTDHATLPPGQTRWLQLVWRNPTTCTSDGATSSDGVTTSIDAVPVRVRAGAFTCTESISLDTAIGILTTGC